METNQLNYYTKPISPVYSEDDDDDEGALSSAGESGYGTDSGSGTTSNDSTPSSSVLSSYCSSSSDEDDADVDGQIEYLRVKQAILKRATCVVTGLQEARYDASKAVSMVNEKATAVNDDAPAPIWNEAKEFLESLNYTREGEDDDFFRSSGKKRRPSPRDPAIDLTSVRRVPAHVFELDSTTQQDNRFDLFSSLSPSVFQQGQLIALAPVWSGTSSMKLPLRQPEVNDPPTLDCRSWNEEVSKNPRMTSPFPCLVPLSAISTLDAVDIQEAMSFTEQARIITMPTPPFSVVYANKAFMLLAGLKSSDSVIGKPFESIIRVVEELTSNSSSGQGDDEKYFGSVLPRSNKACRVHFVPVMDRSRRRRLSEDSPQQSFSSPMSHMLIHVEEPSPEERQHILSTAATAAAPPAPMIHKKSFFGQGHEGNVVGAVG